VRAEAIFGARKFGTVEASMTGRVGNTFDEADQAMLAAKREMKGSRESLEPAKPIAKPTGVEVGTGSNKKYKQMASRDLLDLLAEEQIRLEKEANNPARAGWARQQDNGTVVSGGSMAGGRAEIQARYAAQRLDQIEAELKRRGVDVDEINEARFSGRMRAEERLGEAEGGDTSFEFGESVGKTPRVEEPTWWELADEEARAKAAPVAETPPVAQQPREFLNYGKFNSEASPLGQSLNARIRANVEQLRAEGKLDKGFQSFADQRARASEFAKKMVANPLDLDQAKLRNLSGAEVVGLHKVVNDNTLQMEAAARAIAGGLEGDDLASAMRIIDEAQQSTDAALAVIVREKAQTARDLGFFRQVAKNSTDPDVWMVQAKRLLGDKPLPDKVMLEIRRLAREATEVCS
jgi:hypothetical protein